MARQSVSAVSVTLLWRQTGTPAAAISFVNGTSARNSASSAKSTFLHAASPSAGVSAESMQASSPKYAKVPSTSLAYSTPSSRSLSQELLLISVPSLLYVLEALTVTGSEKLPLYVAAME